MMQIVAGKEGKRSLEMDVVTHLQNVKSRNELESSFPSRIHVFLWFLDSRREQLGSVVIDYRPDYEGKATICHVSFNVPFFKFNKRVIITAFARNRYVFSYVVIKSSTL